MKTITHFATARMLTIVMIVLAAVASAGGLLWHSLYRDPQAFVPVLQGQDLVTLLSLPVLAIAMAAAGRTSVRGTLVWIGLVGYLWYTYAGAAVGYAMNAFLLLYIALFSLTVFALVVLLSGLDVAGLRERFDARTPRGPVIGFLLFIAVMLGVIELAQIIQFLATGILPAGVKNSGNVTFFPYAFDLGLIVPLSVLGAIWLWRRAPWGYVLAGAMLIKAATMGLALLSMNWFLMRTGQPSDGLIPFYAFITIGGVGFSIWFLRHCRA